MPTTILKVLVGSRAHGLADETSDFDYRGVFVNPTTEILSLSGSQKHTSWVEGDKSEAGKKDDTSWEIGHFLRLATHCNPSVLEVFAAPVVEATPVGVRLRGLFECVWYPRGVKDAFCGYSVNQRRKLLEDKDGRSAKYACAYLRVLIQAAVLLKTGKLPVDLVRLDFDPQVWHAMEQDHEPDWYPSPYEILLKWRRGEFTPGQVIDTAERVAVIVRERAEQSKQVQDLAPVEALLLNIRKAHWDG